MLVIIDNYDSFTYNLVQYFQILGQDVSVYLNDAVTIADLKALNPDHMVISPGPNAPEQSGISLEVIQAFYQNTSLLGVCLGHQCLAQTLGGNVIQAEDILHGKTSAISHNQTKLFKGIPTPFQATRYHSLAVDPQSLPSCFTIDAWAQQTIMAISHRHYPVFGLQFHPEAILTEHGLKILENFINYEHQNHPGTADQ